MNSLHYRRNTGDLGTSFGDMVCGKMRTILRAWVTSRRGSLTQVHLHIDDPSLVIYQKVAEQKKRDGRKVRVMNGGDLNVESAVVNRLDFDEELSVP